MRKFAGATSETTSTPNGRGCRLKHTKRVGIGSARMSSFGFGLSVVLRQVQHLIWPTTTQIIPQSALRLENAQKPQPVTGRREGDTADTVRWICMSEDSGLPRRSTEKTEQEAALSAAMTQAKVGIFFVVNGDLVFDAVPLEQGELYGDTVGFSGHYDYWQALVPQSPTEQLFKSHAYDYFPRGRVVYFKEISGFKLYADRCMRKADIDKVVAIFQLPSGRVARARDEHYQCASCNSEYVDI